MEPVAAGGADAFHRTGVGILRNLGEQLSVGAGGMDDDRQDAGQRADAEGPDEDQGEDDLWHRATEFQQATGGVIGPGCRRQVARGNEAAQRVRASADREVVEVTSEARKTAEIVRGEADAERNGIYAEAFGQDPEFFAFTRSLTSYERSMQAGNSSIVMSPESEFFDYMNSDQAPEVVAPAVGQ